MTTVVTESGGSTVSQVLTTNALVPVTTIRTTPTLGADSDDSSKSGLDAREKNIIIGVVVGIGGAALLGGLAVVAWRIWGRKKYAAHKDDDDLTDAPGSSSGPEKNSGPGGSSPFRSTLDQYHTQPKPVNTASNF